MTKIKICGLSRELDIKYVNLLMPDYIGFVFANKSRRYINPQNAKLLKAALDPGIKVTGVFVDESIDNILSLVESGTIDAIQLHGDEGQNYIKMLKFATDKPIIKAFRVCSADDINKAVESVADYILLDNGDGGTGEAFDWSLISKVDRPFFLAGGLSAENVAEAIRNYKPYAVDISSGVETEGHKDYNKIKDFINAVLKA